MEKVRLGIIGIGNMGSGHANSIVEGKVPGMELLAATALDVTDTAPDSGFLRRGMN